MNQNDKANLAENSLLLAETLGSAGRTNWVKRELNLKSKIKLGVQPLRLHFLLAVVELIKSWFI